MCYLSSWFLALSFHSVLVVLLALCSDRLFVCLLTWSSFCGHNYKDTLRTQMCFVAHNEKTLHPSICLRFAQPMRGNVTKCIPQRVKGCQIEGSV